MCIRDRSKRGRGAARPTPAPTAGAGAPRVTSPIVRKLAREKGVDVAALTGTGPDGLITRADVLAAAEGSAPQAAPAQAPSAAVPAAEAAAQPGAVDGRTGLAVVARTPISGCAR